MIKVIRGTIGGFNNDIYNLMRVSDNSMTLSHANVTVGIHRKGTVKPL